MVEEARPNNIKWTPIPLTVSLLADGYDVQHHRLREALFETPVSATVKYDGTNVGKDERGTLYGRNLTIAESAGSYQKTSLARVRAADIGAVKQRVLAHAKIDVAAVETFCCYGELMCNVLYDYEARGLAKKGWLVFGAMLRPAEGSIDAAGLTAALCAAGLVARNEDSGQGRVVRLLMTDALRELVADEHIECVESAGTFACMHDLVMANRERMQKGWVEGLIVTVPPLPVAEEGKRQAAAAAQQEGDGDGEAAPCTAERGWWVHKWKNGIESAKTNNKTKLAKLAAEVAAEWAEDEKLCRMARDLFAAMLDVNESRLVCGQAEKVKAKPDKAKKKKKKDEAVLLGEEEHGVYEVAMASAATKFDHADTFFDKGMKAAMEYAGLIADECCKDIGVDKADAKAMERHTSIVQQLTKSEFISHMKRRKAASG